MATQQQKISAEITTGSPVCFKKTDQDPNTQAQLNSWNRTYGRGPHHVHSRVDRYISLKDKKGNFLPLGGGEGLININYVEPWREV